MQEVGSDQPLQECPVPRPVLDVAAPARINGETFAAFLCEAEVLLYKWNKTEASNS